MPLELGIQVGIALAPVWNRVRTLEKDVVTDGWCSDEAAAVLIARRFGSGIVEDLRLAVSQTPCLNGEFPRCLEQDSFFHRHDHCRERQVPTVFECGGIDRLGKRRQGDFRSRGYRDVTADHADLVAAGSEQNKRSEQKREQRPTQPNTSKRRGSQSSSCRQSFHCNSLRRTVTRHLHHWTLASQRPSMSPRP